jgi:hypothetical protein|tara:strand:- start:1149 stop:1271 length:123 start_codon:yes stop_codon:yes gene_type:complete
MSRHWTNSGGGGSGKRRIGAIRPSAYGGKDLKTDVTHLDS